MRIAPFIAAAFASMFLAVGSASALTVEAKVSADFQKKLTKDYGEREAAILTDMLTSKVETIFADRGVKADHVVVTIEDARPNRPTLEQVSNKPGLDPILSISTGGARVTGKAYDASGKEIGTIDYDWFETDISNEFAATTWSDTRHAFDRFARRFADKLT